MADHSVGAVAMVQDGRLIGIFTERLYAPDVILKGRSSPMTPIRDVMDTEVVCAQLDQIVEECMAVITDRRLRHLPVIEDEELTGIVSIGDLVKSKIADQEFIIERLVEYVRGLPRDAASRGVGPAIGGGRYRSSSAGVRVVNASACTCAAISSARMP